MGFLNRLFGREDATPSKPVASHTGQVSLDNVLEEYSTLMLSPEFPALGLSVADTSKLPYPKLDIERALIATILATKDQHLREQATFAYLMLANFQDGVGSKNVGLSDDELRLIATPLKYNDPADPRAVAEMLEFARKAESFELESVKKWTGQVERDRRRLQVKLDRCQETLDAAKRRGPD
jgi:hypothetical protein